MTETRMGQMIEQFCSTQVYHFDTIMYTVHGS